MRRLSSSDFARRPRASCAPRAGCFIQRRASGGEAPAGARFSHDFARTAVFNGKGPAPTASQCDAKCGRGRGELGSTECGYNNDTGRFTGKVAMEVKTKNPCIRPCVETHEKSHARDYAPICKAVKKCTDAAKGNVEKEDKCLDQYEASIAVARTECDAYTIEEKCLQKRAKKAACMTEAGKHEWAEQMRDVQCYKACYCQASAPAPAGAISYLGSLVGKIGGLFR